MLFGFDCSCYLCFLATKETLHFINEKAKYISLKDNGNLSIRKHGLWSVLKQHDSRHILLTATFTSQTARYQL